MDRKQEQIRAAESAIFEWCNLHGLPCPQIDIVWEPRSNGKSSGIYYGHSRSPTSIIRLFPTRCRLHDQIGSVWDHSVYGVAMHELGHHADGAGFAAALKRLEPLALTEYSYKNIHENFAEMFRVYISNPDLFRLLRPKGYRFLGHLFPHHIETRPWDAVLIEGSRDWSVARNLIGAVRCQ